MKLINFRLFLKKNDMESKLKKIIKKKLSKDLSVAELIITKNKSIWFIDRDSRYWFLELEKSGYLWWRWDFFSKFFKFFSIERDEFEPVIKEWVEEVLNQKVISTSFISFTDFKKVEEILSSTKLNTTIIGVKSNGNIIDDMVQTSLL